MNIGTNGTSVLLEADAACDRDAFNAFAGYAQALHERGDRGGEVRLLLGALAPAARAIRAGWKNSGSRSDNATWMRTAWVLQRAEILERKGASLSHRFIVGDVLDPPDFVRALRPRLVFGSPPYLKRRSYGRRDFMRGIVEWIDFMARATEAMLSLSAGPIMWVCNGCIVKGRYQPAVEGLMYELFRRGHHVEHPVLWSKNAAPNRRDWWCNGWEYVVAVIPPACERVWNWEAIATAQKYKTGGRFRQRSVNGSRRLGRAYVRNPLARPYDTVRAVVGGGRMGHPIASEHEAPFPVSLVRPFVQALTNPGDLVLDPFAGSCTTMQACFELGRESYSMDLRGSQQQYFERRLLSLQEGEHA